jgi:hypothetical protein
VISGHPWFARGHYGMDWGWTAASAEGRLLCLALVVLLLSIRLRFGRTRKTLVLAAGAVSVFLLTVGLTTG